MRKLETIKSVFYFCLITFLASVSSPGQESNGKTPNQTGFSNSQRNRTPNGMPKSREASATTAKVTPYSLPVALPSPKKSPKEDPAAPYTPTVKKLISQLEPSSPPTLEELRNASLLLTSERNNGTCHNLANVVSNVLTSPRIMPLCFSDGLGLNTVSGLNRGKTTGLTSMLMLAASFDLKLANAMGQMEGREGRNLMVTGLLGPQADTDEIINWSRGHHTPGEDPYLNGTIVAAQVNGIQGQGLMSEVKHFTGHNGTFDANSLSVQDQALHEMYLQPYELALRDGGASAIMCAYNRLGDLSPYLAKTIDSLTGPSPYGKGNTQTWPLNEFHYACENPLLLTYVLRDLWKSNVFVGSDYGGAHSTSGFLQGDNHEDPSNLYLGATNPVPGGGLVGGPDFSSSTCADVVGKPEACSTPGAVHVSGIPGAGCPPNGCGLAEAVFHGLVPLPVFNQALARVLYQEERFGMLGCDNGSTSCSNPGGINGDRSGTALLPDGPATGAPQLGTKFGDAAIAERVAEEGAVLFKNDDQALPISSTDLQRGIAVSGGGAEYLIANPNNEGALGYADRNAINPLQQLEALSGNSAAFTFTPAGAPTGQASLCAVLSSAPVSGAAPEGAPTSNCTSTSGLQRFSAIPGAELAPDRVDSSLDFTAVSKQGRLEAGKLYRWEGWLYVPSSDTYAFRIQYSSAVSDAKVKFAVDGEDKTLRNAISFYQGQYYGNQDVVVTPTNAGFTEKGLRNRQCPITDKPDPPPSPFAGGDPVDPLDAFLQGSGSPAPVVICALNPTVGWHKVSLTYDTTDLAPGSPVSFRFALSRTEQDIADAAAAAEGKAMAIVFVNDQGRQVSAQTGDPAVEVHVSSIQPEQIRLIDAVAAKNPNTIVVINTGTPIIVKEWIDNPNVKAVLNVWHSGQEGGTAIARLLLGQANPSGHTTITWPRNNDDTIEGFNQPQGLYPGDTPGKHRERLNGGPDGSSVETQGIFSGYRYYDKMNIPVQFPFGYGLSYTTFAFSNLMLTPNNDGTVTVDFDIKNTGKLAGAEVAQVYVGPGPEVPNVQQGVRSLRAYDRIELEPGQSKHVNLKLDQRSFQYWSEPDQKWVMNAGMRTIYVGDADATQRLQLSGSLRLERR